MASFVRKPGEDCLSKGVSWAGGMAAVGVPVGFFNAHTIMKTLPLHEKNKPLRNSLRAFGILANPVATFATIGFTFAATDCAMRNYLGRDDTLTGVVGGLAAGAVMGVKRNSLPAAIGFGGLFAVSMLVTDFVDKILHPVMDDINITHPMKSPSTQA